MSGAQPPPRIRSGRPLILNSRPPVGVSSDVISRTPNFIDARSETLPLTVTSRLRS